MLRELVTRDGLTYKARGYGSRRPIAKNDRESGRRLNRRVTVSFDRPAAEPGPSASASETVGTAAPRPATTSAELPVVATARAVTPPDIERTQWPRQAEVDINELRRDAGGNVLLTWTVRNQDETPLKPYRLPPSGSADARDELEERLGQFLRGLHRRVVAHAV